MRELTVTPAATRALITRRYAYRGPFDVRVHASGGRGDLTTYTVRPGTIVTLTGPADLHRRFARVILRKAGDGTFGRIRHRPSRRHAHFDVSVATDGLVLGGFRDSPELLLAAAEYVQRHGVLTDPV